MVVVHHWIGIFTLTSGTGLQLSHCVYLTSTKCKNIIGSF